VFAPLTPFGFGLASFIVGPYFFSFATKMMSDRILNAEASCTANPAASRGSPARAA